MKVLLEVSYETGNKYEPYDSIDVILHFENDATKEEIFNRCNSTAKDIAGDVLYLYSWEVYND